MDVLFDGNESQCGYRENQLSELCSLLFKAQHLPPPLRGGSIAKMTNMHKNGEIQERPDKCEYDHRNPNRIGMKPNQRGSRTRAQGECSNAYGNPETVDSHDRSTNTLEQGKKET